MSMLDYTLPYTLSGVTFKNRLLNSAGCWCTTEDELLDLANSESGGVVSKSCLREAYGGNPKPRYYADEHNSINSTGLANLGHLFYNEIGERIREKKPYIISMAVNRDIFQMIRNVEKEQHCDFIELNISCPNIVGESILGYEVDACVDFFDTIFHPSVTENSDKLQFGLKLPPYFSRSDVSDMTSVICRYPFKYISCINGMPNGLVLDENHEPVIRPNGGLGGMGGVVAKPFGLANVKMFHELLPEMPIIGCGGIATKKDIQDYLSVGASMVQIGTQVMKEGPSCFSRLLKSE